MSRHLEAYLLWLFGWVLFTSSHGDIVNVRLIAYIRAIANGEAPQISWGSAALAATYCGLCDTCCRSRPNSFLAGSPLLLQLIWGASPLAMALAYAMVSPWLLVNSTQPNSHNK